VRFGEHRLMFRPRDSHDLRLRETTLRISPPTKIRWMHDVFSNSIAIAHFADTADTLSFDSRFTIEHYGLDAPAFPILHYAQTLPFSYPADMIPDLARTNERHYPDPDDRLADWARQFLGGGSNETLTVLNQLNSAIPYRFTYEDRTERLQVPRWRSRPGEAPLPVLCQRSGRETQLTTCSFKPDCVADRFRRSLY